MTRRQLRLQQLAGHAIDRRGCDGTGVHIEPNTRTLSEHGASHKCRIGRADHLHPVTHEFCERGPVPRPPHQKAVTTYRPAEASECLLAAVLDDRSAEGLRDIEEGADQVVDGVRGVGRMTQRAVCV